MVRGTTFSTAIVNMNHRENLQLIFPIKKSQYEIRQLKTVGLLVSRLVAML